jgi:hypothetical protein
MPKFRKKPIEIEAERFDGSVESATRIIDWVLAGGGTAWYREADEMDPTFIAVRTPDATGRVLTGDWLIRGARRDDWYPCKPDIFEATYEQVELAPDGSTVFTGEGHGADRVDGWTLGTIGENR